MHMIFTIMQQGAGFNRYMVECECRLQMQSFVPIWRFNRYMVECESGC